MVGDAESVIGDLLLIETPEVVMNDEIGPQWKIFFRGISWDSSWAQNWDLYADHDYWKCDDIIVEEHPEEVNSEEEDPREEDPEEEVDSEEEDPEEDDPEERGPKDNNEGESSKDSNGTP